MSYIVRNMRLHVDGLDAHISDLDLLCESILDGNPDLFDPDEIGNALIGIRTLLFIRKEIFNDLVLSLEGMNLDDSRILNKIIPIAEDEEEFYESYAGS
jgi:hypothetical protein